MLAKYISHLAMPWNILEMMKSKNAQCAQFTLLPHKALLIQTPFEVKTYFCDITEVFFVVTFWMTLHVGALKACLSVFMTLLKKYWKFLTYLLFRPTFPHVIWVDTSVLFCQLVLFYGRDQIRVKLSDILLCKRIQQITAGCALINLLARNILGHNFCLSNLLGSRQSV